MILKQIIAFNWHRCHMLKFSTGRVPFTFPSGPGSPVVLP